VWLATEASRFLTGQVAWSATRDGALTAPASGQQQDARHGAEGHGGES
jgi:hypothetical protein